MVALAMSGVPSGMAAANDTSMGQGEAGEMSGADPCCPSGHDQSPDHNGCDMKSWLGCAFQCGVPSPVFVPVPGMVLWQPDRAGGGNIAAFLDLVSTDRSPPFRPPRSTILV